MGHDTEDQRLEKQGRLAAIVIAGAMIFWIVAQWIGSRLEIDIWFQVLIDLIALAAFAWAMVVTFQIWRKRQNNKG